MNLCCYLRLPTNTLGTRGQSKETYIRETKLVVNSLVTRHTFRIIEWRHVCSGNSTSSYQWYTLESVTFSTGGLRFPGTRKGGVKYNTI